MMQQAQWHVAQRYLVVLAAPLVVVVALEKEFGQTVPPLVEEITALPEVLADLEETLMRNQSLTIFRLLAF
jgi:hypothetical protein